MKKQSKLLLLAAIVILTSCDDIFEEDISNETVEILNPLDDTVVEGNEVQFSWLALAEADDYNIQVFDQNNVLVVDSTLVSSVFNYTLESKSYSWQVRAQNFAYQTEYATVAIFEVIPFSDLSQQNVSLSNPADELALNSIESLRFSWENIESATSYTFEILESDSGRIIFTESDLTTTEIILERDTELNDNTYTWQVRATNSSSNSDFSSRTFYLDTEAPTAASLASPAQSSETTLGDSITFSWTFADNGTTQTAISALVEIASDSNFDTILYTESANTEGTFDYSPEAAGTYYWRVQGTDEAQNSGEYSTTGTFTVN